MSPDLRRAFEQFSRGDHFGAARTLEVLLRRTPDDANALHMLAGVKRELGEHEQARVLFDAAAERAPRVAPIQFNRANHLLECGMAEKALVGFERALKLRPDHPESHLHRGLALAALGRHTPAMGAFDRARALGFERQPLWSAVGASLFALGSYQEAAQTYARAVAANPRDADALFNQARCLQALERAEEAVALYDASLALEDAAGVWDNRGMALHEAGRYAEALESVDRALVLDPLRAETHSNRGLILSDLGRADEAIAAFEQSLTLATPETTTPEQLASLHFNRGAAHLRAHNLQEGWSGLEARWRAGMVNTPPLDHGEPEWRGERLDGVLRIWPEQGIGDEVLFAQLAPMAKARCAKVVLQCAPRLASLYARSFPDIDVRAVDAPAPGSDAQIAVGSLGPAMNVDARMLGGGAYLVADSAKRDARRACYESLAKGRPIVGIAWASKSPKRGEHKSAPLNAWRSLLLRDYFFVNLQYGDASADAEASIAPIYTDPDVDQLRDLDTFAAQIAALDHVVSVSNTTVHMAGALGTPCIVMPPPARGRLWYWGHEGERTPWYPSVRIVRRGLEEGWDAQVARATAVLASDVG